MPQHLVHAYSWSDNSHDMTLWSLNSTTGTLEWGRGIELEESSSTYSTVMTGNRLSPNLFITHTNLTYITAVVEGYRSGTSGPAKTPAGDDNTYAEYKEKLHF